VTRRGELGTGAGILAFGALVAFVLVPFGVVHPDNIRAGTISPTFWPRAIGWLLIVVGALVALQAALAPPGTGSDIESTPSHGHPGRYYFRVLLGFFILYASWGATFWIGLPISSALIILVFGALFGERRYWLLIVLAVVLPLVLYYFFTHVAKVPIPLGDFFD